MEKFSTTCQQCHQNKTFIMIHTFRCLDCILQKKIPLCSESQIKEKVEVNVPEILIQIKSAYNKSCGNASILYECTKCKLNKVANLRPCYINIFPNLNESFIEPNFGNNLCCECIVELIHNYSQIFIN